MNIVYSLSVGVNVRFDADGVNCQVKGGGWSEQSGGGQETGLMTKLGIMEIRNDDLFCGGFRLGARGAPVLSQHALFWRQMNCSILKVNESDMTPLMLKCIHVHKALL